MSVLSYQSIVKELLDGTLIVIPTPKDQDIQPASLDLHLGEDLIIESGEFLLSTTLEIITLPADLRAELHGRSSVARQGVFVHITGGYIDPGFTGTLTLECYNASPKRKIYKKYDRICQIAFSRLDFPTEKPYKGRYQNQKGTTESRSEHGDM